MRVALDGMGGDNAPGVVVRGAVRAVKSGPDDLEIILVGRKEILEAELSRLAPPPGRVSVYDAPQAAAMTDKPSYVLRHLKRASIRVCFELAQTGRADAVVSAGNTGATMAVGMAVAGRLPLVLRPALASPLPGLRGPLLFIDVGANVDCSPEMLVQFGYMGAAYAERVLGVPNPAVGLLSIGEEGGKGNTVVKQAYHLLDKSALNFVGNVEGRDLFKGDTTVVVCDGFVGNVALKLAEGLSEVVMAFFERRVRMSIWAKLGALLLKQTFKTIARRLDYATYGGAPLLGINGTAIICHGLSSEKAMAAAVKLAAEAAANGVTKAVSDGLAAYQKLAAGDGGPADLAGLLGGTRRVRALYGPGPAGV